MKKLLIKILTLILFLTLCLGVISGCEDASIHTHDYKTLKYDEIKHWYECSCGEKLNMRIHRGGTATCVEYANCEVCDEKYGVFSECSFKNKKCIYCGKKQPVDGLLYYWSIEIDGVTGVLLAGIGTCYETEIIIPKDYQGYPVFSIMSYSFKDCGSITEVVVSDSIKIIEEQAFSNCDSLISVFIPKSVTSVGNNVFEGCSLLTIYCEAESQPSGWAENWNSSNCPVVWGYKGNYTK